MKHNFLTILKERYFLPGGHRNVTFLLVFRDLNAFSEKLSLINFTKMMESNDN